MEQVLISQEKLDRVLEDVKTLVEDMESLFDQDAIVKNRLSDIKRNPSIGKSEEELDDYLKQRGLEVE